MSVFDSECIWRQIDRISMISLQNVSPKSNIWSGQKNEAPNHVKSQLTHDILLFFWL